MARQGWIEVRDVVRMAETERAWLVRPRTAPVWDGGGEQNKDEWAWWVPKSQGQLVVNADAPMQMVLQLAPWYGRWPVVQRWIQKVAALQGVGERLRQEPRMQDTAEPTMLLQQVSAEDIKRLLAMQLSEKRQQTMRQSLEDELQRAFATLGAKAKRGKSEPDVLQRLMQRATEIENLVAALVTNTRKQLERLEVLMAMQRQELRAVQAAQPQAPASNPAVTEGFVVDLG